MVRSRILDADGNHFMKAAPDPGAQRKRRTLAAHGYDVVNRWCDTDKWKYARSHDHVATHPAFVTQRLRDAARFEYQNNSYCRGVVNKIAHEVVKKSPRLEIEPLRATSRSTRAAQRLEKLWAEYSPEVKFRDKLIEIVTENIIGGETFSVFRSNRRLKSVQVDWMTYESDQFSTPDYIWKQWYPYHDIPPVDGMRLDALGNVIEYHKLRNHPGSTHTYNNYFEHEYDPIDPDVCVHLYRKERPSQFRGVSELAPCIELFGKLRRYTEAALETAENAASILGTIETGFQPDLCAEGALGPVEVPIGAGLFMTLPEGWKGNPFRAEQPAQGYAEFKNEILHEIFSALMVPWNVGASDSSSYNFASGRLDFRIWDSYICTIQRTLEEQLLNRFFSFWFDFAVIEGRIPSDLGQFNHKWYWGKKDPIDPNRAANAARTLKEANLLDERSYWQSQDIHPREAIEESIRLKMFRFKREKEIAEELGISIDEYREFAGNGSGSDAGGGGRDANGMFSNSNQRANAA